MSPLALPTLSSRPSITGVLAPWGLSAIISAEHRGPAPLAFAPNRLSLTPTLGTSQQVAVEAVQSHATRRSRNDNWWPWASSHGTDKKVPGRVTTKPGTPLWGRVSAPTTEAGWTRDDEARAEQRRHLAAVGETLDLQLLAALGRPTRGGDARVASAWDMTPRNRGTNLVADRLRPLRDMISPFGMDSGARVPVAEQLLDATTVTTAEASVGTTGWDLPGQHSNAVRKWCALWAMALFPVVVVDGVARTLGHLGRLYDREWLVAPVAIAGNTFEAARAVVWDPRFHLAGTVGLSDSERRQALVSRSVVPLSACSGGAPGEQDAQEAADSLAREGWLLVRWPLDGRTGSAALRWSLAGQFLVTEHTRVFLEQASDPLAHLGQRVRHASAVLENSRADLYAQVKESVADGVSESEVARLAGIDRMTVRKVLGKRAAGQAI